MNNKNGTKYPKNSHILLYNGRFVHIGLLNFIKSEVSKIIPGLSPVHSFTLKQLFGEKIWYTLDSGDQKNAGWCMKHLVATGELPFRIVRTRHEYPIYYKLI